MDADLSIERIGAPKESTLLLDEGLACIWRGVRRRFQHARGFCVEPNAGCEAERHTETVPDTRLHGSHDGVQRGEEEALELFERISTHDGADVAFLTRSRESSWVQEAHRCFVVVFCTPAGARPTHSRGDGEDKMEEMAVCWLHLDRQLVIVICHFLSILLRQLGSRPFQPSLAGSLEARGERRAIQNG